MLLTPSPIIGRGRICENWTIRPLCPDEYIGTSLPGTGEKETRKEYIKIHFG